MVTHRAVWLANVTGMDGSQRPAYARIGEDSAYRVNDEFVVGWWDEIEAERPEDVPEIMFARHNADNRPSGQTCRSMSVGDVVVVGETAYACESGGFRVLDAAPRTIHPDTFADLLAGSR